MDNDNQCTEVLYYVPPGSHRFISTSCVESVKVQGVVVIDEQGVLHDATPENDNVWFLLELVAYSMQGTRLAVFNNERFMLVNEKQENTGVIRRARIKQILKTTPIPNPHDIELIRVAVRDFTIRALTNTTS